MGELASCAAGACISSETVVILFAIVMGCYGAGYVIGHSVLWVKRLQDVA